MILGKIKRIFLSYQNKEENLSKIDLNLLRGILRPKLKDFDDEYRNKMKKLTLYERLAQATRYKELQYESQSFQQAFNITHTGLLQKTAIFTDED